MKKQHIILIVCVLILILALGASLPLDILSNDIYVYPFTYEIKPGDEDEMQCTIQTWVGTYVGNYTEITQWSLVIYLFDPSGTRRITYSNQEIYDTYEVGDSFGVIWEPKFGQNFDKVGSWRVYAKVAAYRPRYMDVKSGNFYINVVYSDGLSQLNVWVKDSETGAAVSGAKVALYNGTTNVGYGSGSTWPDGHYTDREVQEGSVKVVVTKSGYDTSTTYAQLSNNMDFTVNLVKTTQHTITCWTCLNGQPTSDVFNATVCPEGWSTTVPDCEETVTCYQCQDGENVPGTFTNSCPEGWYSEPQDCLEEILCFKCVEGKEVNDTFISSTCPTGWFPNHQDCSKQLNLWYTINIPLLGEVPLIFVILGALVVCLALIMVVKRR